jgi:hypothetical protein
VLLRIRPFEARGRTFVGAKGARKRVPARQTAPALRLLEQTGELNRKNRGASQARLIGPFTRACHSRQTKGLTGNPESPPVKQMRLMDSRSVAPRAKGNDMARADPTGSRLSGSEMAPQAVGIAQNGLEKGARQRHPRCDRLERSALGRNRWREPPRPPRA